MEVAGTITAVMFALTLLAIVVAVGVALVKVTSRKGRDAAAEANAEPPTPAWPHADTYVEGQTELQRQDSHNPSPFITCEAEVSSQATDRPNQAGSTATAPDPEVHRYPSSPQQH